MAVVMLANGSVASAYAEIDLGADYTDLWIGLRLAATADAIALWSTGSSGSFVFTQNATLDEGQTFLNIANDLWQNAGGDPLADEWQDITIHWSLGGTILVKVNGATVADDPDVLLTARRILRFGDSGPTPDPAEAVYIDSVTVGTTEGGTDLFADDFESGTFDAWTTTDGDVSLVADPYAPVVGPRVHVDENWRIIVTSIATETLSILDKRVSGGMFLFPRAAPAYHSGQVPADDPEINIPWPDETSQANVSNNTRLIYAFRREAGSPPYECRFGGIIMSIEDQGTDIPVSRYTAYDPWQYMFNRPVRNPYTGALPDPATGLTFPTGSLASDIALLLLEATETVDGNTFIDLTDLSLVSDTEPLPGPITFDAGLSVGEAWNQLVATGTIDIALPPLYDPGGRPGKVCMFQCASMLGQVRYGAVMSWDRSIRTVMNLSRLIDGTRLANQVQWFGANGQPVALQSGAGSIAAYGEYWAQQFFPDATNAAVLELGALAELLIRRYGERTVSLDVAPEAPELSLRDYLPGDWLPVWASRNLREPITVDYGAFLSDPTEPGAAGYQRIQAIPISLDDNGVETVPGLMLSRDGAGSGS